MRATTRGAARPAVAPLVLLLLAAAAVLLLRPPGDRPTPAGAPATAAGALVSRTALACPAGTPARGVIGAVRLGLAPGLDGAAAGGRVSRGPVAGAGTVARLTRGRLVGAAGGPDPVQVRADGAAAAGLFGFRTDRRSGGGLAAVGCERPRARWWFTGAGAGLDHTSTLELVNLDPGPAVVDVRVLGPDGEVDTVRSQGIVLRPHSSRRIALTDIASQTDDLALDVHASRGRVVAAVADSFSARAGRTPGLEWLPGTDRARREVDLAGLPAGASGRTLLVANPSDLEATVDVRVTGRSGSFAPTGLGTVTVAPGALERVDLDGVLPAREPVGLRLRSGSPVVATVRSVVGDDTSYAAPIVPLTGAAAAPVVAGAEVSVRLTSGAAATRSAVTAYDGRGRRLGRATVAVPATATRPWTASRGAAYVVVGPLDGGAVRGAVSYGGGAGTATVPLVDLPFREQRPSVRPGLR
jgi:hypothetical protein